MSYSTRIMNLPLGASCQDQHDAYAVEKSRVSQLAKKLGPIAENCHRLHGDYDSAAVKRAAAIEERSRCQTSQQDWGRRKAEFDAYTAYKSACAKYLDAKKKHADLVKSIAATNAKMRSDWETAVARVKRENYSISQDYASKRARYQSALTTWQQKNAAYSAYRSAVSSQSYGLSMQWSSTQRSNPSYFSKYSWPYLTTRCGSRMRCVTKDWKAFYQSKCVGVRGLGALGATAPNASTCQYYYHYPVCPDSCPSWAPHPGSKPTPPPAPTYKTAPSEPTYKTPPTLDEYLNKAGVKKMPDDCGSATPKPDPGKKPSCDPNAPLPAVPPKPTCTPPEIPPMPVAPTCKPSILSQVGPMWLLLAAGGAGLYWYSKKR